MNDYVLMWCANVMLQVTCVSAFGLAIVACFHRDAAARCWALCSTLCVLLLTPFLTAVMLKSGHGLLTVKMYHTQELPLDDADSHLVRDDISTEQIGEVGRSDRENRSTESEILFGSTSGAEEFSRTSMPENEPFDGRLTASAEVGTISLPETEMPRSKGMSIAPPLSNEKNNVPKSGGLLGTTERFVLTSLVWMWFAGAALLFTRLVASVWWMNRLLISAKRNTNEALDGMLAHVCDQFKLQCLPKLAFSDQVSSPISASVFRPSVVLPAGITESVSISQLHDILVHEVAHIVRRDHLMVLLQHLAGALYWFHPLVRWSNRALAQAREEVCDNYVLATTDAPAYSRTLLTLTELALTRQTIPIVVGLFTSKWKLENRVAGLLDERRNRVPVLGIRSKLLLTALSLTIAIVAAFGTVTLATGSDTDETASSEPAASPKQAASSELATPSKPAASATAIDESRSKSGEDTFRGSPTLRGEGKNRSMLLRGRVVDVDGTPAQEFELVAKAYKSLRRRDVLPTKVKGSDFEVSVPIADSHWFLVDLAATANDGRSRAVESIGNRKLRQAAIEGIELRLVPNNRSVAISVTHNGAPVANAHVNAELSDNILLQSQTDSHGKLTFQLSDRETLRQLTAWTEEYRIGGYSFSRSPRRDPFGDEFTIELDDCHDQTVRFLHAKDGSPVPNLRFALVIGTGHPNYNFAAVPASFAPCRMTTDENGESTFRWFPNWETHGAYVDIIDPGWATAVEHNDLKAADDGALVMTMKRRVSRKPIAGQVTSDHFDVGGLLVEIKSFQGEEEGRSDHVYAFTDANGNFTADCIPGATYCVCVNDGQLQSDMIDLIPYEPDTGKSNVAELKVLQGNPIEIRVTSGVDHEPMRNQQVSVRQVHHYTWIEDGEERSGGSARDYPVYTDDDGIARARALPGAELRITVYAGEWRSDQRTVTVNPEGVTYVEFHRAVDVERAVTGRLIVPTDIEVDLASTEIIYGSIDGETDEKGAITADAQGRFAFKTKAIQLGLFAYTADGKAVGVAKPGNLDAPINVQLRPTADLHGQLLGENDEPLVNHAVRVTPRVKGQSQTNRTFSTSFGTKTFETRTDDNGNYTLKNLPSELEMSLRADAIDDSRGDAYVDRFYLVVNDDRPLMVSRLGKQRQPDNRSLSEKYASELRDARLGDFHLFVVIFDSTSNDFVHRNLLNPESTKEIMSYLSFQMREAVLADEAAQQFVESQNWPLPERGTVFVCALDGAGKELGRVALDVSSADAISQAARFIRAHAPPQADAIAKWDAAFAEAKRSSRRVWARVSQRYCGPCFRLSRWLDDNRELLERDYVFLKFDDVRDKHGVEVAHRIVSKRESFGVPFHAIFDDNEELLIDSEGPTGNIGHPSSFEGRRHLMKMLSQTMKSLTDAEIEQIVSTLE